MADQLRIQRLLSSLSDLSCILGLQGSLSYGPQDEMRPKIVWVSCQLLLVDHHGFWVSLRLGSVTCPSWHGVAFGL